MSNLNDELTVLRSLKDTAEEIGRTKKEADQAFKQQQARCLDLAEAAQCGSWRSKDNGYLFTFETDGVKGQVEDRKLYVRWALENDEAILEFLDWISQQDGYDPKTEELFFDAIMNTSIVKYKEDGHVLNQQARTHTNDKAPLPPGATFRPDPKVSMRRS
jgi:hypothetical protein